LSHINKAAAAAMIPALILGSSQVAARNDASRNALTIYSTAQPGAISPELYRSGGRGQAVPGYAVVRHEREIALNRGRNSVRFTDVAAYIDPTTDVASLTDPAGTSVVEQNFQFDLVNQAKLLEKYIDRTITVDQVRGQSVETFSGTLLSTAGGMTLKRDDGTVQLLRTTPA